VVFEKNVKFEMFGSKNANWQSRYISVCIIDVWTRNWAALSVYAYEAFFYSMHVTNQQHYQDNSEP